MGADSDFAKPRLGVYLREKTGYTVRSSGNLGKKVDGGSPPSLRSYGAAQNKLFCFVDVFCGGVAEWLKAHAWKVCNGASRS